MNLLSICALIALLSVFTFIRADSSVQIFGNNEYKVFTDSLRWEDAEESCQLWGGYLASIVSQEENQFLQTISDDFTWIGLNEVEVQGYWEWADMSLEARALVETNFTNWLSGQPVPEANDKCVHMLPDGLWDNFDCSAQFNYVCKRVAGSCGWGNQIMGAPKPQLLTEIIDGTDVVISIELAQQENRTVRYELSFDQIESNADRCRSGLDVLPEFWNVTRNACSATIEARFSLSDFVEISNASLRLTPGSNVVDLSSTLHIAYYDNQEGACQMSHFYSPISISTILNAESSLEFDFVDGNVLNPSSFSSITVNDDGRLVFTTQFTPAYDGFRLKDFHFSSHSRGINFLISSSEEDCVSGTSCEYTLNVISATSESDFSGILYVDFTFVWSTGNTTRSQMAFLLKYNILSEPPVMNNIIETDTSLMNSEFSLMLNTFTPFERTYVLTKTIPPMDVPNVEFSFENVYICCTRGMMTLPAFDPSQNQFGCSVQNDTIMSFWKQLVLDGEANSDMYVEFEDLGPLIRSQVALSFDPIELFGDDKLCYIHSTTTINLNADSPSSLVSARSSDEGLITSNSLRAVTVQSCSVYSSESKCKSNEWCSWDSDISACFNSNDGDHSNGAESMFSVCSFMGFVILAISTLLLL
mmetsp:Transcript_4880/g.18311  ORF Transcript_4880/g.18311 Transcript_4880/m.18311 type:complete len:644 (-) Transcript_4880:201-2132(-)|eukprot:CAMPEP_0117437938 /NCGR_PEP_ID=MMETSP0759-20121206/1790_1 /TAXON_ID=63605 /ORGANISM="Percolomonas cosmopolitus, Strain WS" /LENGTH=643 /DNA_ID=CAMNT_0005229603 /DNA_START=163 /DNA_END=2094 /DNA_ORIENTATION=+